MEVRGTFSAPARARASEGQPTGRQGLNRPFSAQGRVDQEQTLRKPPPQGQRRLRPRGLHRTHNDAAAELSAPSRSRSEQRTWLKTTGSRPVASASCGRNSARIGGESGQPTSSVPPISTQSSLLSAAKSFSTTGYPPHPCRLVPRHETLALKGLRGLQLLPKFSFFWKGGARNRPDSFVDCLYAFQIGRVSGPSPGNPSRARPASSVMRELAWWERSWPASPGGLEDLPGVFRRPAFLLR